MREYQQKSQLWKENIFPRLIFQQTAREEFFMTCVKILWNIANLCITFTLLGLSLKFTTGFLLSLGITLVAFQLLITLVLNNRLRDTEQTKEQPLNDCVLALFNSIILISSVIYFVLSAYAGVLQFVGVFTFYLIAFNLSLLLISCLNKNGHYCIYKFCKRRIFGKCERKFECSPHSRANRCCAKLGDKIVSYLACQCCCAKKKKKKTFPQISFHPTVYSYTMDHTPTSKFMLNKEYPRRHQSSNNSSANLSESVHYPTSRFIRQEVNNEKRVNDMERRSRTSENMMTPKYKEGSTMKITNISMSQVNDSDDSSIKGSPITIKRMSVRTVITKTRNKIEKAKRNSSKSAKKNPTLELSLSDKNLLHELNICCLCIEEFRAGQKLTVAPGCQHHFHITCLSEYIAKNEPQCPICKRDLFQFKVF